MDGKAAGQRQADGERAIESERQVQERTQEKRGSAHRAATLPGTSAASVSQGAWTAPGPTPHWGQRGKLRHREGKDVSCSTLGTQVEPSSGLRPSLFHFLLPPIHLPLPPGITGHQQTLPALWGPLSWSVTQTAPTTPSSTRNSPVPRQGQPRARPRAPRST